VLGNPEPAQADYKISSRLGRKRFQDLGFLVADCSREIGYLGRNYSDTFFRGQDRGPGRFPPVQIDGPGMAFLERSYPFAFSERGKSPRFCSLISYRMPRQCVYRPAVRSCRSTYPLIAVKRLKQAARGGKLAQNFFDFTLTVFRLGRAYRQFGRRAGQVGFQYFGIERILTAFSYRLSRNMAG